MKKNTFLLGLVVVLSSMISCSKDEALTPFISDDDFVIKKTNYTIYYDETDDGIENYVWNFGPHAMNTVCTYNQTNGTITNLNETNTLTTTTVLNSNNGLMDCLSYQGNPLTLDFRVEGQVTTIIDVSSGTNPPSYKIRKAIEEYTILSNP